MKLQYFLLPLACLYAVNAADSDESGNLISQYIHVPTSCDTESCVAGGCLFENCANPLSCKGGLCYYRGATFSMSRGRKCKEAVCEGGACIFDDTAKVACPGGGCQFVNVPTTLADGYCNGGGCTLEGDSHPSSLTGSLAE